MTGRAPGYRFALSDPSLLEARVRTRHLLVGAMFALSMFSGPRPGDAQPTRRPGSEPPLPPAKAVTDLKSVAGQWDATASCTTGPSGSFVWIFRGDGSFQIPQLGNTGTVRVSNGKLLYQNPVTGRSGVLVLHEDAGGRVLRGARDDGVCTFELRPRTIAATEPARGQPTNVHRIGILALGGSPTAQLGADAFGQSLLELGWIVGQNLIVEYRSAEGRPERLDELAAELVRLKVELVVSACGPQIPAIGKASSTMPIVSVCPDLAGLGLIASLARPGGNITGISILGRELIAKRLQLLKEGVPKASRVASLMYSVYDPAGFSREMDSGARAMGVKALQPVGVRGPEDFEAAFATMAKERADALVVLADPFTLRHRQRIADLAAKSQLPAMFDVREFVDAGGLMSYGPKMSDMFRRTAVFVDKILKGAKPGDLPAEQPTTFELVINLKTAKTLGLTIPRSVLQRADEIIQ